MKRYHSLLGTGSGIGCHITPDMLAAADTTEAMRENHSGCWVTYHEARGIEDRLNAITQQLAINTAEFDASTAAAYDRGLIQGRKEGQVKVDAMRAAVAGYQDPETIQKRVDAAYELGLTQGRTQASQTVVDMTSDTRTNQLLNELYHDRARLEKVVATAVKRADEAAASASALLSVLYPAESKALTQVVADLIMDAAKLRQFADDNGDKE